MRRQLVLLITSTTLLVLLAFLLPLTTLLRTLAVDRAVAEATREAQNLAVVVAVADPAQLSAAVTLLNQRGPRTVTLVLPDGTMLGSADPGPAASLALAQAGRSFSAVVGDGREIYVPVDTPAGRAVVLSFVPESLLHRGVAPAVAVLVGLGVGLLLVSLLIADRLAVGASRPMRQLADTALSLAGGNLDARAEPAGPREVREVGHALNVLAERIGALLMAERETIADLSHRLRTPLTALRLDAESLSGAEQAARVTEHVDALQRALDGIIQEARRTVREGVQARCDAAEVIQERATFWSVLMEDQDRAFGLEVAATPHPVRCTAEDLGAAVDALLQNTLLHTSDGVAVAVRVHPRADGGAEVVVEDRGPGYPQQTLVRGRSTAGSSGLGLDIVRRTAEASGGELMLGANPEGGARSTLVLGPAR